MLAVPERKEKLYLHRAVYLRRTAPRIVYPCVESGGGSRKLAEGENRSLFTEESGHNP